MRYFKRFKGKDEVMEITKEQARNTLDGYWNGLDEIFEQEKSFRLYTPYSEVWTMTEDGAVTMAGFYGTSGN